MRGTWPKIATDEIANRLWLDDLVKLDSRLALETFRNMRDDWAEARVPSWANFLATYRQKAKVYADRPGRALGEGTYQQPTETDKARVRTLVADLSEKLKLAGQRKQSRHRESRPVPDGPKEAATYSEMYGEVREAILEMQQTHDDEGHHKLFEHQEIL